MRMRALGVMKLACILHLLLLACLKGALLLIERVKELLLIIAQGMRDR